MTDAIGSQFANRRSARRVMILFGAVWILGLLAFDAILLSQFAKERHARGTFAQTAGVVVTSELVRDRTTRTNHRPSQVYRPRIVYRYEVNGQNFEGGRYAYSLWSSSDDSQAREIVGRHPVGSGVVVHYDPSDPQNAVLDVSGKTFPRFIVFFLIPFHCVGLGLIYLGIGRTLGAFLSPRGDPDRARHIVSERPGRAVIRLRPASAVLCGLTGTGVLSFILIFVIAFGFGTNPGGRVLEYGAAAAGAAFVLGFCLGWWLDVRPSNRLIVDTVRGEYRLKRLPVGSTREIIGVEVVPCATGVTGLPFGREVRLLRAQGGPLTVCRTKGGDQAGEGLAGAIRDAFGLSVSEVLYPPC